MIGYKIIELNISVVTHRNPTCHSPVSQLLSLQMLYTQKGETQDLKKNASIGI